MIKVPDSLLEAVHRLGNVVLTTHVNPDGDALGSLLGLADVLRRMEKRVFRFLPEQVSQNYRFLPDSDCVQNSIEKLNQFIVSSREDIGLIVLDCGDKKRLGENWSELLRIRPSIVIDHHKGNNGFGDFYWIDPDRSSTGEMIFDLVEELNQKLTLQAAKCLFTAIVTDTGSFRYGSTTSYTFEVARRLIEDGVSPDEIGDALYNNYTVGQIRLMQLVLSSLQMFNNDQIAVIQVTRDMLTKTSTTIEDTENFINMVRAIKSVQVAVFLKEVEKEVVGVSLRAKGGCDVADVAARFGGGGHRNAAGFKQSGIELSEVLERLMPELRKELDL